jgi:hypothetical protein
MATYKKLPGSGRDFGGYSHLWQGEDHLLLITSTGISEEYRRFYYSDIQAFIVRKTARGIVLNCVFGTLAGLFSILALMFPPLVLVFPTLAVVSGAAILINTFLGPTCTCYLQTATARHSLLSLHRLRHVRNVINGTIPLITTEQGEITVEQLNSLGAPVVTDDLPPVLGP